MNIEWTKKSNAVIEKITKDKYITDSKIEKLEYPKPEKRKSIPQISEGEKGELDFTPKKADAVKEKEIRYPGKIEKLEYNKSVEMPKEGEPNIKVDTNLPDKYMASDTQKGNIKKSPKNIDMPNISKTEVVQNQKYWLTFEKAKTTQKQFSLIKDAGRSFEEWMKILKEKGVNRKARRKFQHIWKNALKEGKSEEYAARAAIDSLPKKALENPTKYHGKEKSGPLVEKNASLSDIIGFTLLSFIKWAHEYPEEAKQLFNELEIYQFKPVIETIKKNAGDVDLEKSLMEQIEAKKKELAELEKKLAEERAKPSA